MAQPNQASSSDVKESEEYWTMRLLEAIHAPFKQAEDGHEHKYEITDKNGILTRDCSICGFHEPIATVTRLIE